MLFSKYIKNKKITWLLALFISFVFVILSILPDVYRSVGEKIYTSETARYGSYHYIWYNMPETYVNRYRKDENVRSMGFLCSFGKYIAGTDDYEIVLGYADPEALRLGSITLIEGSWPQNDSELVIEEVYKLSGFAALGDSVVLSDVTGNKKEYEVTGFISSYSHFLETTDSKGNTDLCPNALTFSPETYVTKNCNVYIEYDVDLDPVSKPDPLGTYMTKLNDYTVESNDKIENSIFRTSLTNMFNKCISMRDMITAYVFVFYGFALFFLYTIYLKEAKEDSVQLYRLGASSKEVIINLVTIMLLIFVIGIVMGIIISLLLRTVLVLLTDIKVSVIGGYASAFWMFFGLVPIMGIYVFTNHLYSEEIMFTKKWGNRKVIRAKGLSVWDLARFDFQKNMAQYLILSVFLALIIVFFLHFDYQIKETAAGLDLTKHWIGITAGTGDRSVYNGVKDYVSIDDINSLYSYEGIDHISKSDEYGGWKGYTVLRKGESKYVDALIEFNDASPYKGKLPEELNSDEYSILYNYNNKISFYVVNESGAEWLKKYYPQISSDSLDNGKVVVIASKLRNTTYTLLPESYYDPEASFAVGNMINIIYQADPESTGKEYFIETYEISDIIKSDFISQEGDRFDNHVFVIMSEKTASLGISYPAITSARVYLRDDITVQQYGDIMKAIMEMTERGVHARYYTSEELNTVNQEINTVFYSTNIAVFALILCVFLYLVTTFIYLGFIENKKVYGILRSFGMDEMTVRKISVRESVLISAVTFVISMVMSVISVFIIQNDVAGIRITKEMANRLNLNECVTALLICFVICSSIAFICSVLLRKLVERYFRESIASMIRFKE